MNRSLILVALIGLSACGVSEPTNDIASPAPKAAVQTAILTGLYEGGNAPQRNQMCIIDRATGDARFGLVVWGSEMHSCSGIGAAVRRGDELRLEMAGDEPCVIEARIEGTRVAFPAALPESCRYYCGARARLEGASFEKVGGTAEDAMRATDLVGDPLCASAGRR